MVRRQGRLVEVGWEEALDAAADGLRSAGEKLVGIGGARASNEDLYMLRRLVEGRGGQAHVDRSLGGGDLVQAVGAGSGTRLSDLTQGDAILVFASDLHEEAPIWYLALRQAALRGATLLVAHARPTRLEAEARFALRYSYGREVETALSLLQAATGRKDRASSRSTLEGHPVEELDKFAGSGAIVAAGRALAEASNVLVFYGGEGMDYPSSSAVARTFADLLASTGHVGKPKNGLAAVSVAANWQGAWDMGLRPSPTGLAAALKGSGAVYLVASDPAGDDPALAQALDAAGFVVVHELYRTATAERADVVFPAQSFVEREGTYTSGLRRVQRFYPAVPPLGGSRPDWQITAEIGRRLGGRVRRGLARRDHGEHSPGGSRLCQRHLPGAGPRRSAVARRRRAEPLLRRDVVHQPAGPGDQRAGRRQREGRHLPPAMSNRPRRPPRRGDAPGPGGAVVRPRGHRPALGDAFRPLGRTVASRSPPPMRLVLGLQPGHMVEVLWDGRREKLPAIVREGVPVGAALHSAQQRRAADVSGSR